MAHSIDELLKTDRPFPKIKTEDISHDLLIYNCEFYYISVSNVYASSRGSGLRLQDAIVTSVPFGRLSILADEAFSFLNYIECHKFVYLFMWHSRYNIPISRKRWT